VLREAVVLKVRLLLSEEYEGRPGLSSTQCTIALVMIVRAAIDDKMAQVFIAGLQLLEDLLASAKRSLRSIITPLNFSISIIYFLFIY
jgi:hypothetical protein